MQGSNLAMVQSTPEFWFLQARAKGGAKAHVDAHPQSTWSMQLCGEKRWRLSPVGVRKAPHVMKLYQDGQIYGRDEHLSWNIFEEVLLRPGDALFFAPGFIHQTFGEGKSPAASITWQFDTPPPSTFLRTFLFRLRFTPDLLESWQQMGELIGRARRIRDLSAIHSDDLVDFLDVNGDGHVTRQEKKKVLKMWDLALESIRSQLPKEIQQIQLGINEVVHDEQDLMRIPKKLRSAIRNWEEKALQLDDEAGREHTDL